MTQLPHTRMNNKSVIFPCVSPGLSADASWTRERIHQSWQKQNESIGNTRLAGWSLDSKMFDSEQVLMNQDCYITLITSAICYSQTETEKLLDGGRYDDKEDFAVVLQPFFKSTILPFNAVSLPCAHHPPLRSRCIYM